MEGFRITKIRFLTYAFIGSICICLGYIINLTNPMQKLIKSQLKVREGTLLFEFFKKPPVELYISAYIFNITNAEAFLSGQDKKIKLDEVGPYTYREYLEHQNYTFNPNGTLSYYPKRRWEFIPERSVNDPRKDVITAPNLALLAGSTLTTDLNFVIAMGFSTMAKTLKLKPIINITAYDYLWGYEDPIARLAYNILPSYITFNKIGLLDRMFDEGENLVQIKLSKSDIEDDPFYDQINIDEHSDVMGTEQNVLINNIASTFNSRLNNLNVDHDKLGTEINQKNLYNVSDTNYEASRDYSIQTWNGDEGLTYWGHSKSDKSRNTVCNTLKGAYDGGLFPRNISKTEEYRVYRKAFCRTMAIKYNRTETFHGVEVYRFVIPDDGFDNDYDSPKSSCFCKHKKCLKKGLGKMTPCYYNIPAAASFPHFYKADPSLLDGVEGMKPNSTRHESQMLFQPQLGIPIAGTSSLQLNLLIGETKFNSEIKPFDNTVLPIVWVQAKCDGIPQLFMVALYILFNILPWAHIITIYLLYIIGIALFAIAVLGLCYLPQPNHSYEPKRNIRYSAMYMFPYIKREFEKCVEDDTKFERV